MDQVDVTRLGKESLRISISIMDIRSEGYIKTYSAYGAFSDFHRSVISVFVSGALVKSPTICNITSGKTGFQLDFKQT